MRNSILLIIAFTICHVSYSQQLPLLKISPDSSYIIQENNKAFFWLGGTAWELIHRLNREEVDEYLKDRSEKGFTVIQTVILAELDGLNTPNAYGNTPLIDNDPSRLNEQYFQHVDYVLEKANELGLYIGLLPTWGDKFNKKWGVGPVIFTAENAYTYGELLAKRYDHYNNFIWILGGDRGIENENHNRVIQSMAKGIRDIDKRHLITYHPVGSKKASDYVDDNWLDLDMYQSGHSSKSKEYSYLMDSIKKRIKRPIINGESRYENIPDRFWEKKEYGWLDDSDVRVSAYWSMIAGAAGYTYGCNDIWQMYDIDREATISARTGWQTALQLPGSTQMGYMKKIFEHFPWQKLILDQSLILNENTENEAYMLAAIDSDHQFAFIYIPTGDPVTIDISKLNGQQIKAFWFNPRSGKTKFIGNFESSNPQEFTPWSSGRGSDFMLILTVENYQIDFKE